MKCFPWSFHKDTNNVSLKNEACEVAYAAELPPPRLFDLRGRMVVKLLNAANAGLVIQTIGRVQRGDVSSMYRVEGLLLGSGRSAQVRLATHRMTGKRVAMKSFLKRTGKVNYMRNEAQVALRLDHPHVARLLEVWEDNFAVHFIIEYCPDGDLLQWIRRRFRGAKLTAEFYRENEQISRALITQILRVVGHLHHEQLVSRDIKADHFLIDGIPKLKLIDLGLARSFSYESRPMKAACGSLPYVAPEVLLGNYTSQCDLWSVGCIMYMLLTGDPPFHGSESEIANKILASDFHVQLPPTCAAALSSECKDLLQRLLTQNPNDRIDAESAYRHVSNIHPPLQPTVLSLSPGNAVPALRRVPNQKFFRKVVLSLMAFGLSTDEMWDLDTLFSYADHGGTGVLTPADLESLLTRIDPTLSRAEAGKIAEAMDIFDRGGIYFNDFICCFLGSVIPLDDGHLRTTFWKFDRSRTGQVSVENMRQVLGTLYSDRVLEKFLRESDRDGDKYIDFDEFRWIAKDEPPVESTESDKSS
ncbi:protein kinase domain protein [Gregarina niphandrodes]|uniref:Protein kinase domain protein n=1 Tax=Gregarina niphandrodes TaxID=110365 RepID=A0A023B2N7_GRENI|nr:protein kinase domain protein [Gregarina niphandrodes]EZG55070.1 protein kinase domain protein [Gregarina niphandrodes]|eukprot:XP_011131796.1 protein kinase domain protein [Gregarina niphandrodes]